MQLANTVLSRDASLKAYWKAEDLNDASGNSKTLTNNNSVAFNPARYANGFDLGASNSNKSLQRLDNLGITSRVMSMVCWVRLQTEIASSSYIFLEHVNNTSKGYAALRYNYNSGTPLIQAEEYKIGGGDVQTFVSKTQTMGTLLWWHLALVSDGTNFNLYVNGYPQTQASCVANGSTGIDDRMNIGFNHIPTGAASGPNGYSSAIIDDVAVFSRALTQTEVQSLAFPGADFLQHFM
jgi:hypothetical protein